MRRACPVVFLPALCASCGWLPVGEGIASLLPTSDLPLAATAAYPAWGTLDTSALTLQVTIGGAVLDQYGAGVAGVVICYGPNEDEAVAIAETDSAGSYSGAPPHSFSGASGNRIWAYLPLYRFEPDGVQLQGPLVGETTLDFKAYPAVYPVPPERDCR